MDVLRCPVARASFAATVAALAACGLLGVAGCYDVDALRGGPRAGAGTVDATDSVASPVHDAAPPGFCARNADAALFCDDFDEPLGTPLELRWTGIEGILPGILITGDAAATRATGPVEPVSWPHLLDTRAEGRESTRRNAVLGAVREVPPQARGIVVSASLRLGAFQSGWDGGFGPKRDGAAEPTRANLPNPFVSVLGGGILGVDTIGATLVLSPSGLELRSGVQTTDVARTAVGLVARFEYRDVLSQGWMRLGFAFGERAVVEAYAARVTGAPPSCPAAPAIAVGWSALPIGHSACIPLDDRALPLVGRLVGIVLGPSFDEPAEVRTYYDDALMELIP